MGGHSKRKYHKQRPYRRRRRKFFKKPAINSEIYTSSNYRRTVPPKKSTAYSWGSEDSKSNKNNWYQGEYQDDFERSHDFYQPSLEKAYRDHYKYSERHKNVHPSDDEDDFYEYEYEYTR